jgi:hypothetical protein
MAKGKGGPEWPHPEGPRGFRHAIGMVARWVGEDAPKAGQALTRRGRKARARARREVQRIGVPMPKALR